MHDAGLCIPGCIASLDYLKEETENCKMSPIKHEDVRNELDYMNDNSIDSSRTQIRVGLELS